MRLIDADELKKRFIGNRYGVKAIDYQIDNTPTVNAIPKEWIREYICDLEVEASSMRKRVLHNDKTLYNLNFRIFQIKELVKDWEKENEID